MSKKIYTVSSMDIPSDTKADWLVAGAFSSREDAVKFCVDYIVERISLRPDIRYAFMHNEEDDDVLDVVATLSMRCPGEVEAWKMDILPYFKYDFTWSDEPWTPPTSVVDAIRRYLYDHMKDAEEYRIETDPDSEIGSEEYVFRISEVELDLRREGQ
jgi:hypothetical protein